MNLFNELTRRKVFKVGAAYLVVAWLAVQAASIAFPAFDAPGWALRIFILVALLGFPISLVFAWAFDYTPDGLKPETSSRSSKIIFAIVAVLVVLAFAWYFKGQPSYREPAESNAQATTSNTAKTNVAVGKNSIAVMPFVNMSSDKEQEYFSDGMTEELLNVLAKMPQLKVVARTSVFEFKDKGGDIREIGQKLGVAHIIEGSVRRDGQNVRVTAQLVRVSDGFHVWSETYDRKLESVFALQDDIAKKISEALVQSLGTVMPIAARAAIDPVAYDEYLKGRALYRKRENLPVAIGHLKAAVERAPEFAAGWASLSLAYEVTYWSTTAQERTALGDLFVLQVAAAKRAAALDPDAAMTLHALANQARSKGQFIEAEGIYLRAIEADNSYADVREDYAELLTGVGRLADAEAAARELVTIDPYVAIFWWRILQLGLITDRVALIDEAASHFRIINPTGMNAVAGRYQRELKKGNIAAARVELGKALRVSPKTMANDALLFAWATHDPSADSALARAKIRDSVADVDYAALRPDADLFFEAYENEQAQQNRYGLYSTLATPVAQPFLKDPRAKKLLRAYGYEAYWREKGWPALCRPLGANDFECGAEAKKQ